MWPVGVDVVVVGRVFFPGFVEYCGIIHALNVVRMHARRQQLLHDIYSKLQLLPLLSATLLCFFRSLAGCWLVVLPMFAAGRRCCAIATGWRCGLYKVVWWCCVVGAVDAAAAAAERCLFACSFRNSLHKTSPISVGGLSIFGDCILSFFFLCVIKPKIKGQQ